MTNVQMVRLKVAQEQADEVESEVRTLFEAVAQAAPQGMRYVALRTGETLTLLLHLEPGVDNPLLGIEAAGRFRGQMATWAVDGPPRPVEAEVLGDYGFLGEPARQEPA